MTKEKIRQVIKRLSYIIPMIREGKTEGKFYISKRTEKIVVDQESRVIVEVLDDIMRHEKEDWVKDIYRRIQEGEKDVHILMYSPVSKGKYYFLKDSWVNKIYACCIWKGIVTYEEILTEPIG